MTNLFRILLLALIVSGLSACAGNKTDKEAALPPEESVETLYNRAADLLDRSEYVDAAKQFSEVERQHPYSTWATKAQLMEGFAYYQNMDYDQAVNALSQFIDLHPGNSDAAYAFYLRALSYYEQISDVRRDQTAAHEALAGMQEVVTRFPDSSYAKDAALKISLINDHLAGSEMNIGRWYLNQKLYTAAIDRFKLVVDKYQTTSHVPEAMERLVECYLALGITDEARSTAAVLGYNYPGSDWYQDAYNLLVQNNVTPTKPPVKEGGSWFDNSWASDAWHSVF